MSQVKFFKYGNTHELIAEISLKRDPNYGRAKLAYILNVITQANLP